MSAVESRREREKLALVIDAFEVGDPDRHVVSSTIETLECRGWRVERQDLVCGGFAVAMSPEERRAYETDTPLQADETRDAAAAVGRADALVFCYRRSLFGVPPILKGWLDRVLVLGVAFEFGPSGRVRPAMRNVKRIGSVSVSPHGRMRTLRARDLARRTLGRTLWLSCSRRCRRTFVDLGPSRDEDEASTVIARRFSRW